MRILRVIKTFNVALLLLCSCIPTPLVAQTETLESLVKTNSYTLTALNGSLSGEGMDFLIKASDGVQYLLAFGYGAPSDSTELLARIAEVERRPASTETIEGLLATAFPSPEEARDYIGEWTGDILMKPEQPRAGRTMLRIRVVEGRVIGETVNPDAPPEFRVKRWEYLRITPVGMTWGNPNGMRPRAVVLFEGRLEGDILYGKSRFGGIDFSQADGSPPPSLYFSFKRVRK